MVAIMLRVIAELLAPGVEDALVRFLLGFRPSQQAGFRKVELFEDMLGDATGEAGAGRRKIRDRTRLTMNEWMIWSRIVDGKRDVGGHERGVRVFNVELQALPMDGRIVLMPPPTEEVSEAVDGQAG
jgi:hypothetical protein